LEGGFFEWQGDGAVTWLGRKRWLIGVMGGGGTTKEAVGCGSGGLGAGEAVDQERLWVRRVGGRLWARRIGHERLRVDCDGP